MTRWLGIALALILLLTIAVRFAEPILDGDLFWHMAYARQMLDRHTLIPDHTAYSWTPSSNRFIYCSWLSELILYGLHKLFGLGAIFVFRYACVALAVALAWRFAHRLGLGFAPLTAVILVILVAGSYAGSIPKPEIFSLVCFQLLVWCFFQWKAFGSHRWLWAMPLIMLVWVNSHGGFMLAAPFFLVILVGEAVERRLNRQLLAAIAGCGLATFFTPYFWRYPWQLIEDYILRRTPRPDESWNDAMQNIFSHGATGGHYPELLILMAAILTILSIRARRFDWTLVLMNLAYVPLFVVYLRSTSYLPAAFAYSALYLASAESASAFRNSIAVRIAATACFAVLAIQISVGAVRGPNYGGWTGFGIGYANPSAEAEYLAASPLSGPMYNLFDGGGYLLWRLDPRFQVMTDSRSFPYLSWFDDQYNFTIGRNTAQFLEKYQAQVAVIDLLHETLWRHFLESPEWRAVFYGPSSAIFVKQTGPAAPVDHADLAGVRNAQSVLRMFNFARAIGDFKTAWSALDRAETRLSWQETEGDLEAARAYRDEQAALRAGDWRRANNLFQIAFHNRYQNDRDRLVDFFLQSIEKLREQGQSPDASPFPEALRKLAVPE
jgi:hypothetical protein